MPDASPPPPLQQPPILGRAPRPQRLPRPDHAQAEQAGARSYARGEPKGPLPPHALDPRRDAVIHREAHDVAHEDHGGQGVPCGLAVAVDQVGDGEVGADGVLAADAGHGDEEGRPGEVVRGAEAPEEEAEGDEQGGGGEEGEAVFGLHCADLGVGGVSWVFVGGGGVRSGLEVAAGEQEEQGVGGGAGEGEGEEDAYQRGDVAEADDGGREGVGRSGEDV